MYILSKPSSLSSGEEGRESSMVNFSSSFLWMNVVEGWMKNYWGFHACDAAPML
jgi:hypothetical protein